MQVLADATLFALTHGKDLLLEPLAFSDVDAHATHQNDRPRRVEHGEFAHQRVPFIAVYQVSLNGLQCSSTGHDLMIAGLIKRGEFGGPKLCIGFSQPIALKGRQSRHLSIQISVASPDVLHPGKAREVIHEGRKALFALPERSVDSLTPSDVPRYGRGANYSALPVSDRTDRQ